MDVYAANKKGKFCPANKNIRQLDKQQKTASFYAPSKLREGVKILMVVTIVNKRVISKAPWREAIAVYGPRTPRTHRAVDPKERAPAILSEMLRT